MELNTKRVLCIIGGIEALDLAIGTGQLKITEHMLPVSAIPAVQDWAAFFAFVISIVMTGITGGSWATDTSGATAAPKPAAPPPVAATIALVLGLGLAFSTFNVGGAHAQGIVKKVTAVTTDAITPPCLLIIDPLKLCGKLTGKPDEDIQRVAQRIAKVADDDIAYAMAKATAANTPASKIRLMCLQAISEAHAQATGAGLKKPDGTDWPRPDPAAITLIEDIAELVDNLSPQGKLFTSCAGAAQMFKTNTLTAINGLVTGAASLAAVGL